MNKIFVLSDVGTVNAAIQFIRALVSRGAVGGDKPLAVYVGPERKLRTLQQNARLWAIYGRISESTGFSKDDLHEYAKRRFLGVEVKEVFGMRVECVRSSADLAPDDFEDFVLAVEAMAAEQGIEL